MKKNLVLLAAILFLWLPSAVEADISVSLEPDRSEATLVDSIRVVVTLKGSGKGGPSPTLRGVDLFHVSRGGTSSRVEILNGRVSASVEYTYFLRPKHTGSFRIGPAEVTVKGKVYRSNMARLVVAKAAETSAGDRGAFFLSAALSSEKAYVEEQLLYTLKLYRRGAVRDVSLSLPEIDHLAFTQLGEPREYESVAMGKPYQVLEIRYALVPSRDGTFTLGPSRMNMTVLESGSRGRGSFFDNPLFSLTRGRPLTLASEAFELQVSALPEEARPVDFSGLVGRFAVTSNLEPATIRAGESATLTVRVAGRGNVTRIPDLKVQGQGRAKVYADQPVLETKQDSEGIGGAKTMKWALVPEKAGRMEIPPLKIGYFDTGTRGYRILETPVHVLSVLPGQEEKPVAASAPEAGRRSKGSPKETVRELGRDILPVHTSMSDFAVSSRIVPDGWLFFFLLLAPVLGYGIALGTMQFRKQSAEALPATRARSSARDFLKQCGRGGVGPKDAIDAVRDYLNRRFNLSMGTLTSEDAIEILASRGVGPETARAMGAVLRRLEDAVYTGKGDETCDAVEDLRALVKTIEKEIR